MSEPAPDTSTQEDLNANGKRTAFYTTIATLIKSYFFVRFFDCTTNRQPENKGTYFVDADGDSFQHSERYLPFPHRNSYVTSISHLAHAARFENQEIIKLSLDHGAHLQVSGALWQAAEAGNIAAAEVLVDRGVDVDEIIPDKNHDDLKFRAAQVEKFLSHSREARLYTLQPVETVSTCSDFGQVKVRILCSLGLITLIQLKL